MLHLLCIDSVLEHKASIGPYRRMVSYNDGDRDGTSLHSAESVLSLDSEVDGKPYESEMVRRWITMNRLYLLFSLLSCSSSVPALPHHQKRRLMGASLHGRTSGSSEQEGTGRLCSLCCSSSSLEK